MLSSSSVFNYVWRHFCSIFPDAENLQVSYDGSPEAKVKIPNSGMAFLGKTVPFPEEVYWHNWQGQNLPFLFPPENSGLLLEHPDGTLSITSDIIAGAFFFLSGWQEYYSEIRDRFGRFPYTESLQSKHGFVTLPVVNYYFDILKTALEKAYKVELKTRVWANSGFVTFLSHDIDRLESAWKVEGKKQFKNGNLANFIKLGLQKLAGHDHWNNLNKVKESVKKFGAISTFFWLPQPGKFQKYPNADYDLEGEEYQQSLKKLAEAGFENGIHGSFGTSENAAQFEIEKARLPEKIAGNRFHYLCYNPKVTPGILAAAGISYDCTLGFAEHFGFRNSYCFPFRPFDFLSQKPYPFLEIPLNLMDATLWHPNYLQISTSEIINAIAPMLAEVKKFNGCFGLLWHNENFSELNTQNGLAAFEAIMLELNKLQSSFKTGKEISEIFESKI